MPPLERMRGRFEGARSVEEVVNLAGEVGPELLGLVQSFLAGAVSFGELRRERVLSAALHFWGRPWNRMEVSAETAIEEGVTTLMDDLLLPLWEDNLPVQVTHPNLAEHIAGPGSTLVHVQAKDQVVFYERFSAFHRRNERFFGAGIPFMTAPVLGPDGGVLTGVGFGQRPVVRYVGYHELRLEALSRAVGTARLLINRGASIGSDELLQMVSYFLQHSGVDPANPAFAHSLGEDAFGFMRTHTGPPSTTSRRTSSRPSKRTKGKA